MILHKGKHYKDQYSSSL